MIVLEESQMVDDSGGMMAPIKPPPIEYTYGQEHFFQLMSDLHIGAAWTDYKSIQDDLLKAKRLGARVAINGDVFDAIITKDIKRFSPQTLHSSIQGRDDILNGALDLAEGILAPYADLIDMIGVGNHETSVEKYHSLDMVRLLIDRLKAHQSDPSHVIHYGGYNGSMCYRFKYKGDHHGSVYLDINYFHGSGGAAPVTRGTIKFSRRSTWLEGYDLHWMGHHHGRISFPTVTRGLNSTRTAHVEREVRHVMTGAYGDTYRDQTQASVRRNGRRTNYAADYGGEPKPKGGALVTFKVVRDTACSGGRKKVIEVTQ